AGEEDAQRRLEPRDERLRERALLAEMCRSGRVDDRSGEYGADEKGDEPSDDEEDEKTAHELEECGIREERDRVARRLLRQPHECRSSDESENDAQDDPRDDEGDKQDQAQDEQADRARTIDSENAIENVAKTPTMIAAAPVMRRPLFSRPMATALVLSPERRYSSCIRERSSTS